MTDEKITIGGAGVLPCLHCGEMVELAGDLHLCKANEREWVNKSDVAIMQMPNGDLFDIKSNKIIKSLKGEEKNEKNRPE